MYVHTVESKYSLLPIHVHVYIQTAGLGGMKPNTLAMGFYTKDLPINTLETLYSRVLKRHKIIRYLLKDTSIDKYNLVNSRLPPLRKSVSDDFSE